jgi:multiple sugar transport system substrate-binding protein
MEEMENMSKKGLFALLLIVMVFALALPALAQDNPYADVDPTGATVEFWHQHTGDREVALNDIVARFNETNPWGITVVASNQGGYGDIYNKMNLGLIGGGSELPQLVVAYQNQAATYALADGLADMNPMVDSAEWGLTADEQADFFPGFFNQDVFPTFDNARFGFPPNRSMEVMYYNIDWLAELYANGAISFEGAPTTPEQFREAACAAVTNPFSGATGDTSASVGYEFSNDASRVASWAFAFGGDVFDYEAGQYAYDSQAVIDSMTFMQELFADGCATAVTERFGDQTNFGAGTTLFTVGSSSGLPFYRSAIEAGANHAWSVGAIPHTTEEPVMNIYGASVSIPRSTPAQELAAWLFVKYYTSPEIQAEWSTVSQYFPVRASVADGLADLFAADPAFKTAFDMLQFGKTEPPTPAYDVVRDLIEQAAAAIVNGADVVETLTAANVEANQILADQE